MRIKTLFTSMKVLTAACVGGGLEMYDFVLYIFFAPTIAVLFFPRNNHFISMLATYSVFAIGFFMRPIGGIIFGHFGDKTGRKTWLLVTILLMGFSTLAMGFLPTYQQIGITAPLLLIFLRMLQGIAVGGDLPGAITFVFEHSSSKTRGFNCGMVYLGVNVGQLCASGVAAMITNFCTNTQLHSWGWRIAFFISALLVLLGYYLRRHLTESNIFLHAKQKQQLLKKPFLSLVRREHLCEILAGIFLVWLHAVVIVQFFMQMPTFLYQHSIKTMGEALYINTASLALLSLLIPFMGLLSDFLGRKTVLIISSLSLVISIYPIYLLLLSQNFTTIIFGLLLVDILSALVIGAVPVTLAELFATKHRYTGVALSYNIGFAIFAGLTPIILTIVDEVFINPAMESLNIIVAALFCLLGCFLAKNKTHDLKT